LLPDHLQVDWWDRQEGLPSNAKIHYPRLDEAAAFACTANACSMPIFAGAEIEPTVRRVLMP